MLESAVPSLPVSSLSRLHSFAASVPAAGLGRRLKPKNGRKKWHLWYITSIPLSFHKRSWYCISEG